MLCLSLQKHSLNLTQIQHKPFVSILQYLWYAMDIWYARYSLIFSPKNLFQDRFQCIFFVEAKLEILFRMMEEKIFDSTYYKVIGWKFSWFSASPFLYANTVTTDFDISLKVFPVQVVWNIFSRRERKTGDFLKAITLI